MFIRFVSRALLLATGLAFTAAAHADLPAYLYVVGQHQGAIKGSVSQKGRDGGMLVVATNHLTGSGLEGAGMTVGKVQHKAFLVTKEVDAASPALHAALGQSELLPSVTVKYWTTSLTASGGGGEAQTYTVLLTNAHIISIHHVLPNVRQADLMRMPAFEEIAFAYEGITWTWMNGASYTDGAPPSAPKATR